MITPMGDSINSSSESREIGYFYLEINIIRQDF